MPFLAGTGEQQPVTAVSGPGLGVPVSIWPHVPVPGSDPGPGPGRVRAVRLVCGQGPRPGRRADHHRILPAW